MLFNASHFQFVIWLCSIYFFVSAVVGNLSLSSFRLYFLAIILFSPYVNLQAHFSK